MLGASRCRMMSRHLVSWITSGWRVERLRLGAKGRSWHGVKGTRRGRRGGRGEEFTFGSGCLRQHDQNDIGRWNEVPSTLKFR